MNEMSYGGNGTVVSIPPRPAAKAKPAAAKVASNGRAANGAVEFARMSSAEKVAYHRARWDCILG